MKLSYTAAILIAMSCLYPPIALLVGPFVVVALAVKLLRKVSFGRREREEAREWQKVIKASRTPKQWDMESCKRRLESLEEMLNRLDRKKVKAKRLPEVTIRSDDPCMP